MKQIEFNGEIIYIFPDNVNREFFLKDLSRKYRIKKDYHWSGERTFYDTFDWRLYNNGLCLYYDKEKIYLKSWDEERAAKSVQVKRKPKFAGQLPAGSLKRELQTILDVRALMPLASVLVDQIRFRILNKDEKTVLYLVLENSCLSDEGKTQELVNTVSLIPVRGFYDYLEVLQKLLHKRDYKEYKANLLERILYLKGFTPGSYSSKINIQLNTEMTADEATKAIVASLFKTMRINEPGLIEDVDTEFLHDYRVAVRRTRSAYSQLRNLFNVTIYEKAKVDFAQLGQWTNRMRDIDVYILRKDEYRAMLPDKMKRDIEPFFRGLNHERKLAQKTLKNNLISEEYMKIVKFWEKFLNKPVPKKPADFQAKWPILEYAQSVILQRFKKVIKLGESISHDSPDELLHKLRIECKKLRYLLEFFASLFSPDKIVFLIKQLKKLQDNLGDFNDLSVQQQTLQKFVDSETNKKTLLSIGMLIGKLNEKQARAKEDYASTFQQFASPETRKIFIKLFVPKFKREK
jgi:CHAD domain-containing protein